MTHLGHIIYIPKCTATHLTGNCTRLLIVHFKHAFCSFILELILFPNVLLMVFTRTCISAQNMIYCEKIALFWI